MVKLSVVVDLESYRALRDIATLERTGHRASVQGVILRAIREMLAQRQAGCSR